VGLASCSSRYSRAASAVLCALRAVSARLAASGGGVAAGVDVRADESPGAGCDGMSPSTCTAVKSVAKLGISADSTDAAVETAGLD
jgi:hypothetical protein